MFYCLAAGLCCAGTQFVGHKIVEISVEISGVVVCSTVWQGDCVVQVPNL